MPDDSRYCPDEIVGDACVVIIDDDAANAGLLKQLMKLGGFVDTFAFTDPRAALAHCSSWLPDLVLVDLHMPDLDGFAVIEALQEMVPSGGFLPIAVLTGDATPEAKSRALAAGAKDFVTKPFDPMEVILRMRNLLETRRLYTKLERHNEELQRALDALAERERQTAAEGKRRRSRIEGALAPEARVMAYQPIVNIATGETVGAEALARFKIQPIRAPDEWFAEALEVGLATEMEVAAVRAALAELDCLPPHTFLAVNVSPAVAMTAALHSLLAEYPGDRLVLELTEHSRIDDYEDLLAGIEPLRLRGIRIAVDDTGAGYAGLHRILTLRPHILKLDTTLTRGIDIDPVRRALATALVTFAREIGATIIAEGIEIPEELAMLRQIGISWAQGYHLGRPGPLPLSSREHGHVG
jgi:EAL domain-containing protein (putative c-di-GMP-specific phosphodiesterase class I)